MKYRDFLQKIIYVIITPVIKGMIRIGFTPNLVTTIGFVLNIAATIMLLYAAGEMTGSTSIVGWSGAVILFAGLFDMMDGRLARIGNMSSMFGALWDSTLDRYSELFTLFGIAMYLILNSWVTGGVLTFLAMVGSVMVSYVRARAEGLGIECKVGLMQRPERVVLTSLGAILCGIFDNLWFLVVPIVIIAILANITAFWRICHCYKVLNKSEKK
ncbi:MAG: CDP-diacylglycerol--inositol 3-phosphatidyltransferase [Prevotella sp. AG:487_50_53]|jgi:CDP-diacylglycerol--glycerol-3-phosphate 3-phosphatidyltransferase|uniref:CDP-alcohol phosphatidyltransferase family protein n=1 Tax=Leyella lascolaii TaxID=1776379 RepID=UPI0009599E5C|nr:CDP-alcohol phosphatidyltransferase family protein [Leyella lascolaii]OKZ28213.1 MAG: CDP-diacylglycerol--inositol 3-phosphatidyltransferase [Prevotella sp. AG:487_50_53]